jgi:hypothetical protein
MNEMSVCWAGVSYTRKESLNLRAQERLWRASRSRFGEIKYGGFVMMDTVFDWCVNVLVYWAGAVGITYKEINVWVFVIIWPVVTASLVLIIFAQQRKIQQLSQRDKPE